MSILDWLFGRPLATSEEHQEKIGPAAGVPVLGLDALASAAYGPVVVVVGELVERRWYHYLLHNQHAQMLKALLYLQGGPGVVVVSVPWHLRD